jgi:starch synthase
MGKTRILYISQEICPYVEENTISRIARNLPQTMLESGCEVRVFMPRFGCVNERRNQLHEVIRLSGMNLVVNDSDHPLIIKVASIQPVRMQVYFIDNEEYFQRKSTTFDKNTGDFYDDNDERSLFFARGVIETVKKLGWSPDIIHCHGWMTSTVPMYIKRVHKDDPLFANSKLIYSIYNDHFPGSLNTEFSQKALIEGIQKTDVEILKNPTHSNLIKHAVDFSDAVVFGEESLNPELVEYVKNNKKIHIEHCDGEMMVETYQKFYDGVLEFEGALAI